MRVGHCFRLPLITCVTYAKAHPFQRLHACLSSIPRIKPCEQGEDLLTPAGLRSQQILNHVYSVNFDQ